MIDEVPLEESSFHLESGDWLLLVTDGVIEAQSKHRELFGFERLARLAEGDVSSAQIAQAAQEFGQQDDITVLRIQRLGAMQPSAGLPPLGMVS